MTAWLAPGGLAFRLSRIDSGGKRIPARLHADGGSQEIILGKLFSFDDGILFARTLKAVIVFSTLLLSGRQGAWGGAAES